MTRTALRIAAVCLVAACSESAPSESPFEPAAAVGGNVASVTGSAHYMSGGELRTMGFSAVQHADGSASGEYQVNIHAIDAYFHVTVTCLALEGNKAWVAGIIDRTNHPVIVPGSVSYFWVVDDGEGPDAQDIMSTARINDVAGADRVFCTLKPDEAFSGLPGNPIVHGNIQVRAR